MQREFLRSISISLFPLTCSLTGCQFFGPQEIEIGRPDYNEVSHLTSQQQLLFQTMQAIAPQTPPVSPSILVGPR